MGNARLLLAAFINYDCCLSSVTQITYSDRHTVHTRYCVQFLILVFHGNLLLWRQLYVYVLFEQFSFYGCFIHVSFFFVCF